MGAVSALGETKVASCLNTVVLKWYCSTTLFSSLCCVVPLPFKYESGSSSLFFFDHS